jgi:hypothetical protein
MALRLAACAIGVAGAAWSIAGVADAYSTASLTPPASFLPQAKPLHHAEAPVDPKKLAFRLAKIAPLVDQQGKTFRSRPRPAIPVVAAAPAAPVIVPDPFAEAVLKANLSPDSVRTAFAEAGVEIVVPEDRFAKVVREANLSSETVRGAFASVGLIEQPEAAFQLASLAPQPEQTVARAVDVFAMPESVPLPAGRPARAAAAPEAASVVAVAPPVAKPSKPAKAMKKPVPVEAPEALAYARPDKPAGGVAGAFKDLLNPPRSAGAGVAVYDISAAVVYMPDGTRLEAHSGIGKMADNPRFAHVKMNGPTPPHTYNLRMRESRFHGVEAIRMLPVDGRNKFGRDGFLTHSYLLRGGREESHGCVAFADYPKFLKAFKQGKVKQIVVVPSISGTRYASLGRGA